MAKEYSTIMNIRKARRGWEGEVYVNNNRIWNKAWYGDRPVSVFKRPTKRWLVRALKRKIRIKIRNDKDQRRRWHQP